MIAYIIEIHKSKFANISFREFDKSEPRHWINFRVYFHRVGYKPSLSYLMWSVGAYYAGNLTNFQVFDKNGQINNEGVDLA